MTSLDESRNGWFPFLNVPSSSLVTNGVSRRSSSKQSNVSFTEGLEWKRLSFLVTSFSPEEIQYFTSFFLTPESPSVFLRFCFGILDFLFDRSLRLLQSVPSVRRQWKPYGWNVIADIPRIGCLSSSARSVLTKEVQQEGSHRYRMLFHVLPVTVQCRRLPPSVSVPARIPLVSSSSSLSVPEDLQAVVSRYRKGRSLLNDMRLRSAPHCLYTFPMFTSESRLYYVQEAIPGPLFSILHLFHQETVSLSQFQHLFFQLVFHTASLLSEKHAYYRPWSLSSSSSLLVTKEGMDRTGDNIWWEYPVFQSSSVFRLRWTKRRCLFYRLVFPDSDVVSLDDEASSSFVFPCMSILQFIFDCLSQGPTLIDPSIYAFLQWVLQTVFEVGPYHPGLSSVYQLPAIPACLRLVTPLTVALVLVQKFPQWEKQAARYRMPSPSLSSSDFSLLFPRRRGPDHIVFSALPVSIQDWFCGPTASPSPSPPLASSPSTALLPNVTLGEYLDLSSVTILPQLRAPTLSILKQNTSNEVDWNAFSRTYGSYLFRSRKEYQQSREWLQRSAFLVQKDILFSMADAAQRRQWMQALQSRVLFCLEYDLLQSLFHYLQRFLRSRQPLLL